MIFLSKLGIITPMAERIIGTFEETPKRGRPLVLVAKRSSREQEKLQEGLCLQGFDVITSVNWQNVMMLVANHNPDLVVVDLDGMAGTCDEELTQLSAPYIVIDQVDHKEALSARTIRYIGPDGGADFFLPKPIDANSLGAHIRASLRTRKGENEKEWVQIGDSRINPRAGIVAKGENEIRLIRTETRLLQLFLKHRGKFLSYNLILESIWGPEYADALDYPKIWVARLNARFEMMGLARPIRHIRKLGYVLDAKTPQEVERELLAKEVITLPDGEYGPDSTENRILAIDRNPSTLNVLRYSLAQSQYTLKVALSGEEAHGIMENFAPDLVIAGKDYLVKPNNSGATVPWIAILEDDLTGPAILESGAADFWVGPPITPELVVGKVNAILKSPAEKQQLKPALGACGVVIDFERNLAFQNEAIIDLAKTEKDLLFYLAQKPNHVRSTDQISANLWGVEYMGNPENVRVWVSKLRSRLKGQVIETSRGQGYRFLSPGQTTEAFSLAK